MRFQSVLDVFEEDRFFISSCPAKRNNMNALCCLGVNKRNRDATEETERYKALLL